MSVPPNVPVYSVASDAGFDSANGDDVSGMGGSVMDDASVAGGSAMDDDLLARQQELQMEIDRIEERSRQNRGRAMASASAAAAQPENAVAAVMKRIAESPSPEQTRKKS